MSHWNHYNELSPPQLERLALLSEELGEAQQVIGKILRHGINSHHPDSPGTSNRMLLEKELGDIELSIALLAEAGDVLRQNIDQAREQKRARVRQWLHHQ